MPRLRTWKRNDQPLEAACVSIQPDKVQLETKDGERIWVSLEELCYADKRWLEMRRVVIEQLNTGKLQLAQATKGSPAAPQAEPAAAEPDVPHSIRPLYSAFAPFRKNLKLSWDNLYFIVESNGIPDHGMMKGIRNWQQQVPLPQPYTGENAWRIPLQPKLTTKPVSSRKSLFRGAIALAVNGVPIFNALNNRGEDAFLIGELDEWGGHCGRADDYHYHAAPLHLEKIVGKGKPIAYALDGYPIYGLTEADGSPVGKLDEFNGQFDADGRYHYHATEAYPYVIGGLRGLVEVRDDQVEPQPHTTPIRPAGEPLRGAVITDFKVLSPNQFRLTYTHRNRTGTIDYALQGNKVEFQFTPPEGRSTSETYDRSARNRRPPPPSGRRPPPPRPSSRPPRG